ncbi:bifunctional (p)ppGpp synthetase/guanosine-3',5'-bis(diphosphate) 3'-pyrophosphohydrolase [bacterium]|nr:bifunctional (p)ppGpp synthetase/guanosine-3',5'-bis(diphosphate) 3'-pyrophosphohydrolase [bacterium]MBU1754456.1 bifunctional (p)ppGpp synthetase/guanosine-3',5'-bis(diphosphate) 3'-pyrophosphohydrolase [bacterium]
MDILASDVDKIINQLLSYAPSADIELIKKAYQVASLAHQDQKRLSGEPFIIHPLEAASILTEFKMDVVTIAAAILHDVVEDTTVTISNIKEQFGDEIALLVEGVSKIAWVHQHSKHEDKAENLRKMLIATAKDIRVILIKLADRLHNMRTLSHLSPDAQKQTALETLEIYAPLAHRLGMGRIKWELEDLSFSYLHPDLYHEIARMVASKRRERELYAEKVREILTEEFNKEGIAADIISRPKHFYSIYQKMNLRHKSFDEIYDLTGIRIVTDKQVDCYNAMGIVHNKWQSIPGRVKDYISTPKSNMYQSIHTAVIGPDGKPMEVQIRTKSMDVIATEGIAAHWHYKEKTKADERYASKFAWLKRVIEWQQELTDPKDFMEGLKQDLFSDEVFIFTPKGQIKILPKGAVPIDYAYSIHSNIGDHCFGAKIGGRMVPLDYKLDNGDIVEIITSIKAHPTQSWIRIVRTPKARSKIRGWLKAHEDEQQKESPHKDIKSKHQEQPSQKPKKSSEGKVIISGISDIAFNLAKCCGPIPGDEIAGYVTKGGITIHRKDCRNLVSVSNGQSRVVDAVWGDDKTGTYEAGIIVRAFDRNNLLKDMLSILAATKITINEAWAKVVDKGIAKCGFIVLIRDKEHLVEIMHILERVKGSIDVYRGRT